MERRLAALRRAVVAEVEDMNRLIFHVLRGGIVLSVAFILFAFVLDAVSGAGLPAATLLPRDIVREVSRFNPSGFLSLGILVLLLTPVARVLLSLISYAKERDLTYVGITGVVLANLLIGILLGVG